MSIHSDNLAGGRQNHILFGAGVYFHGMEYSETEAPSVGDIPDFSFGATQDGGTLTITPEFFRPDLDGVSVAVKELQVKVGETATMDISFAELHADLVKHLTIGKVGATTDNNYEVITSATNLAPGHFYDGFGYYGELLDGRPVIIIFKHALCTSGFTTDAKNKTNSVFKGTFECMSDFEYGVDRLPYAIFIRKSNGWTPVNSDEVANA